MFERYTQKARRVVFFAKYEAVEVSSATIEPAHILLGILRVQRTLFAELSDNKASAEIIRERILVALPPPIGEIQSVKAIEIPLSSASKRVLGYAAEEAERMVSRYIEPKHILIGVLLEGEAITQKVLGEFGIELEGARQKISAASSQRTETDTTDEAKMAELIALIRSNCPDEVAERAFLNFKLASWKDVQETLTALQTHRPAVFEKLTRRLRKS